MQRKVIRLLLVKSVKQSLLVKNYIEYGYITIKLDLKYKPVNNYSRRFINGYFQRVDVDMLKEVVSFIIQRDKAITTSRGEKQHVLNNTETITLPILIKSNTLEYMGII